MSQTNLRDLEIELAHWRRLASAQQQIIQKCPTDEETRQRHVQELACCQGQIQNLRQRIAQMFPPETGEILEFAKDIAKSGADVAERYYSVSEKNQEMGEGDVKNLTTEADKRANETIVRAIQIRYPYHHIIAEEGGDIAGYPREEGFTWVVDAIDGTVNFFLKMPLFCTAIGLLWNREPCAGVIYDPIRREMFYAQKGGPAWRKKRWANGHESLIELYTHPEERLIRAVILTHLSSRRRAREKFTGSGLLDAIANAVRSMRALGSGQLALAYVAEGKFHAFINNSTFSWDQTAGLVIVEAAGGVVTDFRGQHWNIESQSIIAAANQSIHDSIVAIVSAIYPFEEPIDAYFSDLVQSQPELAKELEELLRKRGKRV